jgi:hypothetical protein
MTLHETELAEIIARALPGERFAGVRAAYGDRFRVQLAGGERIMLQLCATPAAAATAVAALRTLRGEVDLPIPQLRGSDADGAAVGRPYLIYSDMAGEPLAQVRDQIGDEQLYRIGRQLGSALYRVHRLACGRYGTLNGPDPLAADDERSYGIARLEEGAARAKALGVLRERDASKLRRWFDTAYHPAGRQAALICGGLAPEHLLVQQNEGRWRLSGLLAWEHAIGWSPAWEHVTLLGTLEGGRYFGLRVGYGNGYDEQNQRTYEQVREHAMRPYQMIAHLEALCRAAESGDREEADRRAAVLQALIRILSEGRDDAGGAKTVISA